MRTLRQTPERLDLDVRRRWRGLAAEVRSDARGRAQAGRPRATVLRNRNTRQHWKDLVGSIRSGSTGKAPHVSIGGPRVPWALSFEFGSYRYPTHTWKGNRAGAGYFLFPAVGDAREHIVSEVRKSLIEAYALAFPDGGSPFAMAA